MFQGNVAQLMAEYNRWMNVRLYEACASLTEAQRREDCGAFFGSIHGTLEHLVWGDRVWLGRFNGETYPATPIGEPLFTEFDAMREARVFMDSEILDWANAIDEAWLGETMSWTSKLYGFTQTQSRHALVMQMFNHQTHHRGQVTALLAQRGVDYGVTDIPVMLNELPG